MLLFMPLITEFSGCNFMKEEAIIHQVDSQGIAKIILNKPEVSNAFDEHIIERLTVILKILATNENVKILMLIANGKNFCGGADIAWMKRMVNFTYQQNIKDALKLAELLKALNEFPMPVIALAQGAVYGGGVGLLACCDIVIAADNAR